MAKKIDLNGLEFYKGKENAMIADEYSSSSTYAVGDYVYHAGTLYKCTTAITTAEAWTSGHWTAAKLAEDLTSQSEKIDALEVYDTIENVGIASFNSNNAFPIGKTVIEIDSESESVTGCTIYHTGKNLYNPQIIIYRSTDGTFTAGTGTGTAYIETGQTSSSAVISDANYKKMLHLPAGHYCGSLKVSYANITIGTLRTIDASTKKGTTIVNLSSDSNKNATFDFTLSSDSVIAFKLSQSNVVFSDLVVASYETGTSYEPYVGTTYNVSWETEAGAITSGEVTVNKDGSTQLVTGGSTYNLTGINPITAYVGKNNIRSSVGNIKSLKYVADTKTYIDEKDSLIKALLAPVLDSMVADTALSANDFRIIGDTLYKITSSIASGGTLTPNTNCVATTIGAEITAILNS